MKIESKATGIHASDEKIFNLLCDCSRLGQFMPPQVQNWQADTDHCEFEVAGIAKIRMEIAEKQEFCYLAYMLSNDKNMPLSFTFTIKNNGADCDLTMKIDVDVPIFIQGMVKGPMQKVADTVVGKIREIVEKE